MPSVTDDRKIQSPNADVLDTFDVHHDGLTALVGDDPKILDIVARLDALSAELAERDDLGQFADDDLALAAELRRRPWLHQNVAKLGLDDEELARRIVLQPGEAGRPALSLVDADEDVPADRAVYAY